MKYPFGMHLWAYGTTDLCRTLNQTLCVPPINSEVLETTCKALRAFRNVLSPHPPNTKKKARPVDIPKQNHQVNRQDKASTSTRYVWADLESRMTTTLTQDKVK